MSERTATRHGCPGCNRLLGRSRHWCGACEARLPREVVVKVRETDAALGHAVKAALAWLRSHPTASERDLDVLSLVAQGQSAEKIAAELGISVHTVKDHLARLSKRWGCKGRAQLIATAFHLGYLKIRKGGES